MSQNEGSNEGGGNSKWGSSIDRLTPLQHAQERVINAIHKMTTISHNDNDPYTLDLEEKLLRNNTALYRAVIDDDSPDEGLGSEEEESDDLEDQTGHTRARAVSGRGKRQRGKSPDPRGVQGTKKQKSTAAAAAAATAAAIVPFSKLQPQPLQLQFPRHPDEERSNDWYRNEFRKLFKRMDSFAREYFGRHDIRQIDGPEPWANMGPEFINYAAAVAEADPACGGWNALLKDTKQRQWLVVAILMRILESRIFETDLWGATPGEKHLLLSLEYAFIESEGIA